MLLICIDRRVMLRYKIKIISILLLFYLFSQNIILNQAYEDTEVLIFGDEKCKKCVEYISKLREELQKSGILRIKIRYYGENAEARKDLHELHEKFNVPMTMRGSVVTIIDNKFIFEGYVSSKIITDFVTEYKNDYRNFILYKDTGDNNYKLMDENGEIKDCQILYSIVECEHAIAKSRSDHTSILILTSILLCGILIFGIILYKKSKKEKLNRTEKKKLYRFEDTRPHRFKKKKSRNFRK